MMSVFAPNSLFRFNRQILYLGNRQNCIIIRKITYNKDYDDEWETNHPTTDKLLS